MSDQTARKHHFVPRFILKQFADGEGRLWVSDVRTGGHRRITPSGVGHERDYHRVEAHGDRSDYVEGLISSIEDRAAPIIRRLLDTGLLPDGSDREAMLALVALQMMRVPAMREFHQPISERKECLRLHGPADTC